ncbi:aspartyl protease family protein At5g10770-like [Dioscorea cayenensis subsp. rotundata]|uniref:Aspartyl protease family protein At5g10770-like n=1 Tax=Dioscorea cayennensis subsp. rotundata TaxID=55577 RepID=A0AB40BWP8_DIOCR|nr:aspartyl protease family protein At5g10770-like [Dioscorea cayenensis subsp. rotundata]
MKHKRHWSHEDELIGISKSAAQIPLKSGILLKTLNYIVSIKLANRKMTMIIDTGSDLTWTQCKPCFSCYIQQDPVFDPHLSSSYQNISCDSSTCIAVKPITSGCTSNGANCGYALSYGDGSYTLGVLGKDKINLGGITVEEFIFGCGRSNHGLFGGVSGIIGLGRTQLSLVSQTINQFGGVFSYCLPTRAFNSSGSLILGNDSSLYRNLTPISYTRLVSGPVKLPFYFVNLTGMIIGGERLTEGLFNGRVLIDSGTVITRLAPSVYRALRDVFTKRFSGYPPAPSFSILDTCFDLSEYEEVKVPIMKFEFEGDVELTVDVTGILYIVKRDASQVCLAVSSLESEDEVGIIGNFQQKNLRVVYDSAGSKLGFAKEICGYDHQN